MAVVKGVTLITKEDTRIQVIADPDMVDLVLRNLLNNAVKFTNAGGSVSIDVSVADGFAWVAVTDTGVGIAQDALKMAFERDACETTTGTAGETGVGMGLILSRDMVEANGGVISAESELEHGTTFRFSLPLA